MTAKAGLKAGLVGGGIAAILAFTAFIPCLECLSIPLMFLAYAVAGALAAYWLPKPRTAGDGAAAGAIAGAVSGVIGGIVWMIVSAVSYSTMGGVDYLIRNLPAEQLEMLREMGVDPSVIFGSNVVTIVGGVCCGVMVLAAIGLGALVGAIFGAARGEPAAPKGGEIIQG
jgi:hypothetical protein